MKMKKPDAIELLSKISSQEISEEIFNDHFNDGKGPA